MLDMKRTSVGDYVYLPTHGTLKVLIVDIDNHKNRVRVLWLDTRLRPIRLWLAPSCLEPKGEWDGLGAVVGD